MVDVIATSIQYILSIVSKKWVVDIYIELLEGRKRFSDLENISESFSSKVLSDRLKELDHQNIIEKIIINMMPLKAKYQLTDKGRALNNIFYEIFMFALENYNSELKLENYNTNLILEKLKEDLGIE